MKRFHDLDALRAVAMLLGILIHTSTFLIQFPEDYPLIYPIQESYAQTTPVEFNPYSWLSPAIHGFRMSLFFLLSGFFTALLLQRRGLPQLAIHRLKRIGLPLILGAFTIIPINRWLLGGEDVWPFGWLVVWQRSLYHLWFLLYLLIHAFAFMGAARLGIKFSHRLWWLAIPLTVLSQFYMTDGGYGADTPFYTIPDLNLIFYYGLFFGFGAFFYETGISVSRRWSIALLPSLMLVFPAGMVSMGFDGFWALVARAVLHSAYAWLMCFGMMGLFHLIASKERFWVRYMSDSSYWLYLWHLTLIIIAQKLLVDQPINPHVKFALIGMVVPTILLVVYQLCVRYTWVGTMLNGPRVPKLRS